MSDSTAARERALIERAQAGDERALDRLLTSHRPGLRRHVRRRLAPAVRPRCADSDIVQETLVAAAGRIAEFEYRGPGSFRAWLAGIAENAARRAVQHHLGAAKRDVRKEAPRDPQGLGEAGRGGLPSPSHRAMGEEMKRRVAAALAEMPEDYCAVIQLLQHRRLTILEAAELLDRTPNAIKKLHARALADLARRLGVAGRSRRDRS